MKANELREGDTINGLLVIADPHPRFAVEGDIEIELTIEDQKIDQWHMGYVEYKGSFYPALHPYTFGEDAELQDHYVVYRGCRKLHPLEPKIIQNAVYCEKNDTYYRSTNRHDWVSFEVDGHAHYIDGGDAYLRRTVMPPCVQDMSLYENSSPEEIHQKLLWGTYGKSGKEDLKWVVLSKCETDHLENIKKQVTNNKFVLNVIDEELKRRANKKGFKFTFAIGT